MYPASRTPIARRWEEKREEGVKEGVSTVMVYPTTRGFSSNLVLLVIISWAWYLWSRVRKTYLV